MLGGENKSRPPGYTIVEVMIVLAISGVMFLIAATFINGRQERASFTEGVNTMASNLQDVIAQVQSGKYSDAALSCSFSGSGISISSPGVGQSQGSNSTCVFLGKVVYFSYLDPANPNVQDRSYEIFTLAGGRVDVNGNPFTSPDAAKATAVDTPGGSTDPYDLTDRQVVPQNLKIHKVTANNGAAQTWGIGFFQNPSLNVGGAVTSGVETVGLYYIAPQLSHAGNTESAAKAEIAGHGSLRSATSATVCLTDDTRYAEIQLGTPNPASASSGNALVVSVKMDGTTPC